MNTDDLDPRSIEAEEAVLALAIADPDTLDETGFLRPDDFFIVRHGWMWEAVKTIRERGDGVEYLSVVTELERRGRLQESGGAAGVLSLVNKALQYPIFDAPAYARIVHDMAVRRGLIAAASRIARLAHSDETAIDEVVTRAEEEIVGVGERRASAVEQVQSVANVAADLMVEAQMRRDDPRDMVGMRTGLRPVDDMLLGIEPGLAYWIAGRPGMGKSSLLAQMAWGLAEHGCPVLFFSLEMKAEALVRRMICQMARVDNKLLRLGKLPPIEYRKWQAAAARIQNADKYPLFIEARSGRTVADMKAIARRYANKHGIKAVVIDTINRIADVGKAGDQYHGMTAVSHAVADWAHDSAYAVLVAAQLNRGNQQGHNKRPTLATLRDAGAQEEDADVVLGLHREGYYKPDVADLEHVAELLPLKVREGATEAMAKLYWDAKWPGFGMLDQVKSVNLDALART